MEGNQRLSHEVNILSPSRKYLRNRKAGAKSAPVSWKSRVLSKGFSSTGVYTILPSRNGFSPNDLVLMTHYSSCL